MAEVYVTTPQWEGQLQDKARMAMACATNNVMSLKLTVGVEAILIIIINKIHVKFVEKAM